MLVPSSNLQVSKGRWTLDWQADAYRSTQAHQWGTVGGQVRFLEE